RTRSSIKVASLNMRGRHHRGVDKWMHINQIMQDQKIGILCLQETHLSPNDLDSIHTKFGKHLQVFCSEIPDQPNAAGVAIVVNKDLAKYENATTYELIPGRALLITLPWHPSQTLNILCIYAPNIQADNAYFWEQIKAEGIGKPSPDIMLGDFNIVEDALDRLPPSRDSSNATDNLNRLKLGYGLIDGWRNTFPNTLQYTYSQTVRQGAAHSRIDRIYIRENTLRFSSEWEITTAGIPTDHQIVKVRISDETLPFIGKGRWVLPSHVISNKKAMSVLTDMCKTALKEIESITERLPTKNAQLIFERLKCEIKEQAIKEARKVSSQIDKEIKQLQMKKDEVLNDQSIDIESRQLQGAIIQDKIKLLAEHKHKKTRDELAAKFQMESEVASSGFWAR
ncbi:Endonuclease/exonuclease/phosphatase, partial [Pholiota molesta]